MAMKPKVLLTRLLPKPGIDLLRKHAELDINPDDNPISKRDIIERITGKDGLISLLSDTVDAEVINTGSHLKIIANYAVGYSNIDIAEATRRKIPVTNTPGVLTETTADLTFALMLSVARRIVEADRFLRAGKFKGWTPTLFLGNDVHNKILGIVGFGRIGKAVARRAKGFNMNILYYEPERLSEDIEKEYCAEYRNLDALLKESDFICLHVPLNESTRHLISEKQFSIMKKTAYLINVARGQLIDERAMVKALQKKRIAGCALDVFESEPAVEKELTNMSNVVIVPHIGSASTETRTKMALMVAENVIAVLVNNKRPPNAVNPGIYRF